MLKKCATDRAYICLLSLKATVKITNITKQIEPACLKKGPCFCGASVGSSL